MCIHRKTAHVLEKRVIHAHPGFIFSNSIMLQARKLLANYADLQDRISRHLRRVVKRSNPMDCYTSFDEILDICTETSLKTCTQNASFIQLQIKILVDYYSLSTCYNLLLLG